jgi:hypothetical protein
MAEVLCYLHVAGDPDHWVPADEAVGIIHSDCGVLRPDLGLVPAALECAEANGVEPERIVDWDPSQTRWVA